MKRGDNVIDGEIGITIDLKQMWRVVVCALKVKYGFGTVKIATRRKKVARHFSSNYGVEHSISNH